MPKQAGLGDSFITQGVDLSGDVSSVDTISSPMTPIEVTAINNFAHSRVGGLRDGTIGFTSFFDVTSAVSSPGVPLTTVPYVSTYGFPVQVTVTGTVTSVLVSGVESYAVATPAVPANSVLIRNTTGALVTVTITGGTMTAVVINGATAGAGAGVYQLFPGETIYMLYTVAPTWTWANGSSTYTLPAYGTITLAYSSAPTWNWFVLGQEHSALSGLPSADQICTYLRGSAIGNPAACMVAKQTNYDPTRDTSANLTLKVTWMANGYGLEWGKQLTQGFRADVAATTGPAVDDSGAVGLAYGGQAYFQLVEFIGTSVTIDIQSCATSGGSYATTGLTTTAMTAVGAQRLATSNTTAINRYLKVVTTGTFSLATFAVVFIRNGAAGQQF